MFGVGETGCDSGRKGLEQKEHSHSIRVWGWRGFVGFRTGEVVASSSGGAHADPQHVAGHAADDGTQKERQQRQPSQCAHRVVAYAEWHQRALPQQQDCSTTTPPAPAPPLPPQYLWGEGAQVLHARLGLIQVIGTLSSMGGEAIVQCALCAHHVGMHKHLWDLALETHMCGQHI